MGKSCVDAKQTHGIKPYMEIPEQYPPNKPNFGLVVVLAVIALFVVLGVGYLFLHHEAGHLLPNGKPASHARIDRPAQPAFTTDAAYFVAPV
ncbi:MAG TPA: hypothetical protein VFC39_20755 [Acidobacteriaceae bacterium]|nr:hypothetical protein [Acidobacteriaceae bacterium]